MKYALLKTLADGRFHSGERLGQQLAISRTAVWKHINALRELGLECHSVTGKGYRLAEPVELLEVDRIFEAAGEQARRLGLLECHHEVESTNALLMSRAAVLKSGHTCLAEMQRAGRGRRGKVWQSPYGRNIYMSLYWRFQAAPMALSGLGLVVGIAVIRALRELGLEGAGLKWPNDILWQGRKLAGILLEMSGEAAGPCHMVIGVGMNVAMPSEPPQGIDQPWVDLRTALQGEVSRNRVAGRLLHHLLEILPRFERQGLKPYIEEWLAADIYAGHPVVLSLADRTITGRACGIDDSGALLLETPQGRQRFHSGEVSLRPAS